MVKARTLFEAHSAPLDSLGPRGFRILAWLLGALFAATGLLFAAMGAWPVLVFAGAEAVLVVGLVALYRHGAARSAEWVVLTEERIEVRRRVGARLEAAQFDPFWVRLRWEGPRLLLGHRQEAIEIGRFLGQEDREELERRLAAALRAWRNPVFENPQLRE